MKAYHRKALAEIGVTFGPQYVTMMTGEYSDLPAIWGHVIEGPSSRAVIEMVPRGHGGDNKFYLRPNKADKPEQIRVNAYSVHNTQREAVAAFVKRHL